LDLEADQNQAIPVACLSNAKTNLCSVASGLDGSFQTRGIARPGGGIPQERGNRLTLAWTPGGTRQVCARQKYPLGVFPKKEDSLTL